MRKINPYYWWLVGAGYFLITFFFYFNTSQSKFLFDWNTWMLHYQAIGWSGFASCWGDHSMRWGYHILNMIQWNLFGLNQTGWFITAISFHALNATLLAILAYKMLGLLSLSHRLKISVTAGLLWLVSPYHSEPVVWGATILFLALTCFMLAGMIFFLRYSETLKVKYALLVFAFYFCGMFTFEAFVPFFLLLLILWIATSDSDLNRLPFPRFVFVFLVPMAASIALYFLVNKWRIGSWVGHYGEASHLNSDPFLIIPNFFKYVLKLLWVPLYFSFSQRDAVYAFLESKNFVIGGGIALVIAFLFLSWKLIRGSRNWKIVVSWFFFSAAAIIPFINLYFMFYKDIEQDRYVYIFSSFFYAGLAILVFRFLKMWAFLPLAVFFFVSLHFLKRNTYCWEQSGRIAQSLMHDFRWTEANRIFVLLTPDDFNGAYCMRSMPSSTLSEMLRVQRGIDVDSKMFEAYQWNVSSVNDSSVCEVVDSNTLQLKLVNSGGWLWRNSFGATDIDTEHFSAQLNQWYPAFTVRFKNKQPGDVYIYAVNDHWKEVTGF